jgi:protein-S-isoprenylcysteine O-methyltransferase Ste14
MHSERRTTSRIVEAAILLALPLLLHYLFPLLMIVRRPFSYLGIVLMVLGFALSTWAARTFREVGTGYRLHAESSALATSGPFRISRNPMYLAMLIWLAGLAVVLGSLMAFVFPVLLFFIANFFMIPLEERKMEQTFGARYVEYKRRVRRWI